MTPSTAITRTSDIKSPASDSPIDATSHPQMLSSPLETTTPFPFCDTLSFGPKTEETEKSHATAKPAVVNDLKKTQDKKSVRFTESTINKTQEQEVSKDQVITLVLGGLDSTSTESIELDSSPT